MGKARIFANTSLFTAIVTPAVLFQTYNCCISNTQNAEPSFADDDEIPEECLDIRDHVLYGFKDDIDPYEIKTKTILRIPGTYVYNTVKKIANGAFQNTFEQSWFNVTTLIINNELEEIGDDAFLNCYSLKWIQYEDQWSSSHLKRIGSRAFYSCRITGGLNFAGIMDMGKVEEIGDYAFYLCQHITSITLGKQIKSIGLNAFSKINDLCKVDFSDHQSIPDWMYHPNSLFYDSGSDADSNDRTVSVYAKNNTVEEWNDVCQRQDLMGNDPEKPAFKVVPLKATNYDDFIIRDNKIIGIDQGAIVNKDIVSFKFDDDHKITAIADGAFENRFIWMNMFQQMRIDIEGITEIGARAFSGCVCIFGDLVFDENLTTIGDDAFKGCTGIGNVDLSKAKQCTEIKKHAFDGCSSLHTIKFSSCAYTLHESCFAGCSSLSLLNITAEGTGSEWKKPDDEEWKEDTQYPFYNLSKFGTIILPSDFSITDISNWKLSFRRFKLDIESAEDFPNSVHWLITTQAFTVPFERADFSMSDNSIIHSLSSQGVAKIESRGLLTFPTTTIEIADGAFDSKFIERVGDDGSPKKDWILDLIPGIHTIGAKAFNNCSGLVGVLKLPDTITTIGDKAFNNCSHLRGSFQLPNNIKYIGAAAFYNCRLLKSNNMIANSEHIGAFAFGNTEVEKISISSYLKSLDDFAFGGMYKLNTIDISSLRESVSVLDEMQLNPNSFNTSIGGGTVYIDMHADKNQWIEALRKYGLRNDWKVVNRSL